jgi:putative membrane protein
VHLDVIFLCVGMLVAYWYAIKIWGPRIPYSAPVRRSQAILYCTGVLVVYIAGGTPIHELGENYLLSVHMVQHLLFTLVAPPLLLAGVPTWLWEALLVRKNVLPVARVALHPLVAIFLVNFILVVTHLPETVDYALTHHWVHFVVHVLLVASAMMMWWCVITNVPRLPRLSYPYQMAYLFVQSLIPSVIAAFILFSRNAAYSFYGTAPRIWGLDPVEDQQWAAFVMKIVGSLILWGFIGVAFFKWYEMHEKEERGIAWPEVEEELKEMGLSRR